MGLKTISEQFREDLLKVNLRTPPDIIVGLVDFGGISTYSAYRDELGRDGVIHSSNVLDPGNIMDTAKELRDFLLKRNLQVDTEFDKTVIELSANQSETIHNIGSLGTDASVNWRAVVVDTGTIDNAAYATRQANLSRNKQRDITDPSESNADVIADGFNYASLLQSVGIEGKINNFTVPNLQSVSSKDNPVNEDAIKLNLRTNKYSPDEYTSAVLRDAILNKVYERTTYVVDYTNSLKQYTPEEYTYQSFYNINRQASLPEIKEGSATLVQSDTMLMNIGAYMLNYNLQKRFEQNLYNSTYGALTLNEQTYQTTLPATMDPLDLIRVAKDPLDNLVEKNFTITMPRGFISKAAQFLMGLEGIASPFTLWESVDMGGDDLTPQCFLTNEGINSMRALDPTYDAAASQGFTDNTANVRRRHNDDELIRKTGGGQRWALYENLAMNKYSPRFDTQAEAVNFTAKKPRGNYYLGIPENIETTEDLLRTREGFSIINNNVLSSTFKYYGGREYADPPGDIIWENDDNVWAEEFSTASATDSALALTWDKITNNSPDPEVMGYGTKFQLNKSSENDFRPCSILDVTKRVLGAGGVDSPISNIKTRFKDGDYVYSKGGAVVKVNVRLSDDKKRNIYTVPSTKQEIYDAGFCRTWTKVKPFRKVGHLVRYGELIRRERNSVIDRNANYNIFPTKLNVGTLYDQTLLSKDGLRDRFADKNFDKVRARKYMFSIENLAWRESDKFDSLPAYQQGASGGRVMWFPPYGLTFQETSTANWTRHDFLGRPEPIYTYNNTERTGTLSFMIVVDHPSILNLLVQKELAGMSDSEVDAVLAAFWAGCLEYDIFELARIWGVFSNDDIRFLKDVIEGNLSTPATMTADKQANINYAATANAQKPAAFPDSEVKLANDLKGQYVKYFFPNDIPLGEDENYSDIGNQYYKWLTTGTMRVDSPKDSNNLCTYDYRNYVGEGIPNNQGAFYESGSKLNWDACASASRDVISRLVDCCENSLPASGNKFIIKLNGYASAVSPDESGDYNKKLAKRRAKSIVNLFFAPFKTKGYTLEPTLDNDTSFKYEIKKGGRTYVEFSTNELKGKTAAEMLGDVGWSLNNTVQYYDGAAMAEVSPESLDDYVARANNKDCSKIAFSVLSTPACYARRVDLTASVEPSGVAAENQNPVSINGNTEERYSVVNKRDIATRILNKLIGENEYFEYLSENSPVVFNSLKEKLRYFSPAFHSTTPEGLNSRLTFLQQCVRPGATVRKPLCNDEGQERYDVVNTSFGKPPICILRIGDFYNTKIVIDSLMIDYNVIGNSITYDLNPEGIGVQPMIAKVTMSIKTIGGAGLREPVAQLQNALSFNYYANADIYESMSYGQTNLDERMLDNFEVAYDSDVLDISMLPLNVYEEITYDPQSNFDYIGKVVKVHDPITPASLQTGGEPVYNVEHKIKNELDVVHYYDMDYREPFKEMYDNYVAYIKNGAFNWVEVPFEETPVRKYDFFLSLFSSVKSLLDENEIVFFGESKQIEKILYRHIQNSSGGISDNYYSGYFNIGLDSYRKGSNFAFPTLHLYPQVDDRIVNPSEYSFKIFAGAALPRYVDIDYTTRITNTYTENYKALLACEQWFAFMNDDLLRDKLFTLPIQSRQVFRNSLITELETYVQQLLTEWTTTMSETTNLFETAYNSIMKVLPVVDGMDGGASPKGINYLEVAPKLNVSDAPDFTSFFDFYITDPLNIYPYPLTDMSETEFFNVDTYDDDLKRGNFNFLRNQIDEYSKFKTEGRLWYDFTTGEWKIGTTPQSVSVSSMFEKINYEFLYFSNLTLDILNNDKLSNVMRDFNLTEHTVDLSTSFTGANADRKGAMIMDIQNATGMPTDDYNYKYYSLTYSPVNVGNVNPTLEAIKNSLSAYAFEDVMFFGFSNYKINTTTFMDGLRSKMLNASDFTKKEKDLINVFVDKFKLAVAKQAMTLESKITPFLNEFDSLIAQTQSNFDPILTRISKGASDVEGYKLRMFEVDFTKANAHGKTAISNYYKFRKQNS